MSSKTTKIGAAWIKQGGGKEFISVVINNPFGEDMNLVLWPVAEKRSDASPDYDVTKQSDAAKRERAGAAPRTAPRASSTDAGGDFPDDDGNVPF